MKISEKNSPRLSILINLPPASLRMAQNLADRGPLPQPTSYVLSSQLHLSYSSVEASNSRRSCLHIASRRGHLVMCLENI